MTKTIADIAEMGELSIHLPIVDSMDTLRKSLTEIMLYLIDHNFEKLLWILYRIDVDEEKVKKLLAQHLPADAPAVLADLIIVRQQKKEELKLSFKQNDEDHTDDDLKW